jgi:hypothetical protein
MAGLLGQGFDDPRSAAIMALSGGLLRGDMGAGLLGANAAYGNAQNDAMKRQMVMAQMQEQQMRMEEAQRQRAMEAQVQQAARGAMVSPEKANSLSMGPMPGGAEPPQVQPGFNQGEFLKSMYGINPLKAMELERSMAKDNSPLTVAPGASLVDRNTLKPVFTAPKEQSMPAAIQEYQFAQSQGYKGTFEQWDMARKRASGTNVNVGVNTDKSYFGNVAEGLAKNDVAAIDAGRSAPERIASSRRVREVLATNPITGTFAEQRLALNKALTTAGVIDGTNVANTEVLASTLASQTLDAIKTSGLGSGQGFTDKDRAFLERAKSGNIEMTPQALATLADLNERAAVASISRANSVIGKLRSNPQSGTVGGSLDLIDVPAQRPVVRKPPGAAAPAASGRLQFLGFE